MKAGDIVTTQASGGEYFEGHRFELVAEVEHPVPGAPRGTTQRGWRARSLKDGHERIFLDVHFGSFVK